MKIYMKKMILLYKNIFLYKKIMKPKVPLNLRGLYILFVYKNFKYNKLFIKSHVCFKY